MKFRSYALKIGVSLALVMTVLLLGGASNMPDNEKPLGGRAGGAISTITFSEIQWQERSWYVQERHPEFCLVLACTLSGGCHATVVTDKNQRKIQEYFEHRLGVKMEANLRGRRQLLHLWKAQDGICVVCRQKITTLTGWHNHHIVWRSHGGSDSAENRVLLHPNCHRQVHSQGSTVDKPRPVKGV